jgi:putative isomerase
MSTPQPSPYLELLKNRINLREIPFSERGSRIMIFQLDNYLRFKLAERWFKLEGKLESYRERRPIVDQWRFVDHAGDPLDFETTTYPHSIECHSRAGSFTLVFVDNETLMISLPLGRSGIVFHTTADLARTDRRGGVLSTTGDIQRNIAYTSNARILHNEIEPYGSNMQKVRLLVEAGAGDAILLNITPRLGFNRYIPEPASAVCAAARRWHDWFAAAPSVEERYRSQYYYAWWVMRAGLISTRFYTTREAMTPSKTQYVGVWQWDAYFHALAYRHIEMRLAQDQLRIVLDHQCEDGMIPDAIHDEGIVTHLAHPIDADVTKPPLVAWAAWKLFENQPDREFLNEIYEPLVRCNSWWLQKNDLDGNGLCEYQHPFSSGLDDSPLWDVGMPVESPDLNTYLCLEQAALAKIAHEIGEEQDVEFWSQRAAQTVRRMVDLSWDAKAGFFWARHNGAPIHVRTPFNLFPLITGRLPANITNRLIHHLTDPRQFWSPYPIPTVALDDPKFNPNQMWRGPTWVNVNYLLIEGLQHTGNQSLANQLRQRTLEMIARHLDIYEYYNPETGDNPPKAASIFGWSSAIYIDLAIQASRLQEAGIDPLP